eukprot:CAMPEP_0206265972 /NCGR_PEP_ID=MMETSP0047_2-20121206/30309_1 /ASSEMBLY_ACC=CAM_ASM_000192 /TAXON_ID=195065 /ORGANISM="Chroomonas mesostigmatica_cf, Strain CCMP1168" /LENGTH=185 /DNA_ID=CAMNT_0053693961 /DNA_START=51 /DNA_END=606 /DNA_ORIENTATION=-
MTRRDFREKAETMGWTKVCAAAFLPASLSADSARSVSLSPRASVSVFRDAVRRGVCCSCGVMSGGGSWCLVAVCAWELCGGVLERASREMRSSVEGVMLSAACVLGHAAAYRALALSSLRAHRVAFASACFASACFWGVLGCVRDFPGGCTRVQLCPWCVCVLERRAWPRVQLRLRRGGCCAALS